MCIDEDVQPALSAAPCEIIPLAIPRVSSLVVDAIYYGQQRLWKRQIDDVQFQLAQQDSMDENESSLMRHAIAKDKNASDVIKGVYEGGLKTWECSIDLLSFLVEHQNESHMVLNGARVLEIGCGTGLPSLHILKTAPGAHVCMQDYNRDVLELVTMPNVLVNTVLSPAGGSMGDEIHADDDTETCEIDIDFRRTQFVAGDWSNIEEELRRQGREHSFDLVLTSETIYDTDSYKRLHDLLVCVLAQPDVNAQAEGQRVPMVLVAAKSIYFGLSGSILSFSQYVRTRGVFDSECVWQSAAA
ncbi:hypothetical protein BX661DRAFT_143013 [Kickxella alabastrina]|uniref:uncharacterized protein n=1 Tax=Kickxella alabastrina TaxID=61397 RepID=UPI00221F074D|nr:uncharacterized protein BX661DRAFT_143013 [Kickxella alabastrina]KAI7828434.1 hypothetical protein BX661DRAFT_143013 [Kickxella alabastrina]